MAMNDEIGTRNEHTTIKYHQVQDLLKEGRVEQENYLFADMIADIFSKPLNLFLFEKFQPLTLVSYLINNLVAY